MDDRALLEAAARAAGIKYDPEKSKPHPVSGCWWGLWLVYHREPNDSDRRYWNPLTDHGDCARLEDALSITIIWRGDEVLAQCPGVNAIIERLADHGGDKGKARRYASTHAAAAMKGEA